MRTFRSSSGQSRSAQPATRTGPVVALSATAEGGLGAPARRGALIGVFAQFLQQGLSVLATLVLARLLLQSDFGIVAAANSILAFSAVLLAMGFNVSVIRKHDITQEWLSTVFWASLGLALLVGSAFFFGAPFAAAMFGLPEAAPFLRVLAPVVALNVAATVPLGLLRRRLAFGQFWGVQVVAMLLYVLVEVSLALLGLGAWAVIIGQLVLSAAQCVGAFLTARWSPSLVFRAGLLRDEAGFTSIMLGGHGLNYALRNADYWVVGRTLGAAALGTYFIAFVLPSVLRTRITGMVGTVMIPVFAHAQDDPEATRRIYVQCIRAQAVVGLPAMAGVAVLAEPIVGLFFGERWLGAVEPMRWIALAAMLEFVGTTPSHVALARKWAGRVLVSQVVRFAVFLPAVVGFAHLWGTLAAVALAVLVSTAVWCLSQQVLVARPCGLPVRLVVKDLLEFAFVTAVMASAVWGLDRVILNSHEAWRVLAGVLCGLAVYLGTGTLLFRGSFGPTYVQAWRMVRSRR